MFGLENSCMQPMADEYYTLEDYSGNMARWCVGCGDHSILTSVQKLCRDEQLPPEKLVFVSGIGCSSRFPHHIRGYGFHSLHGRALPVAQGIRIRRPDLHVFVNTGDGDCCSIGASHWIHSVRYNMNMVVMLHDNHVYALTKKQGSPTSPQGMITNTHPYGSHLQQLNPLTVTLGMVNVSFVAQVVEWIPSLITAVIKEGFHHKGFSFIRILQRCPAYLPKLYEPMITNPDQLTLLEHPEGLQLDEGTRRMFKNKQDHDQTDIHSAREVASMNEPVPVGIIYRNKSVPCYEDLRKAPRIFTAEMKKEALNKEFDKFAI